MSNYGMCEDAPCCGCCGVSVYGPSDAAYDAYAEDYYSDPAEQPSTDCHPYDEVCGKWGKCRNHGSEQPSADAYDTMEDAAMESFLFGDS